MRQHFLGSIAILILTTVGAAAQSGLPETSRPLNDCNGGGAGSDTINHDCTTNLPKADIPSPSEERKLLENDPAPAQDGATVTAPSGSNGSDSSTEGSSGSAIGGTTSGGATGGGATGGNPAVSGGSL